ncbi:squalene/phytoene synthase family protein [Amycolatopsis japonica]|uniref:squalene/phytoene synthase family protein n=1 Tax=Amycolatopsis japonica TaxID=208439 RepID=UPI00366AD660
MLWKTSRSFAGAITMLPHPLEEIVGFGYLLCRVADSFEDESAMPAADRAALLMRLHAAVELAPGWREEAADLAAHASELLGDSTSEAEVRLVEGLPQLLYGLAKQDKPVQAQVRRCLQDMTAGMAEVVQRQESRRNQWPPFDDVEELLEYCDIAAGTVGSMLTGLFAWYSGEIAANLHELEPRAAAFGRVLQLTNILEDVLPDLEAGRCWLPRDVLTSAGITAPEHLHDPAMRERSAEVRQHLLAMTHHELLQAIAYLDALPSADVAIRRFCTAPLLMAVLTLRKLAGSPVKIGRRAVKGVLAATWFGGSRPALTKKMFDALRKSLPEPRPGLPSAPQPLDTVTAPEIDRGIDAAVRRLTELQSDAGSWHVDYGGMTLFLSQYVITCYVVGDMPDDKTRERMVRNLREHQNPDGGWGIDYDSSSIVLTTVLGYTALRLLGEPADAPHVRYAREFFLQHGGALASPQWGKAILAVLGVMDWEGLYPFLPELWLLPRWLPVHPGRLWCYPRIVYLPLSWLYGSRSVATDDPLLEELRSELYVDAYARTDWVRSRSRVASTDLLRKRSWLLKASFIALHWYESVAPAKLRAKALAVVLDHIEHEDRTSDFVGEGYMTKAFNTLVWHFARPGGEEITAHCKRSPEHLWDAPDGVKVQCYDSTQTWDTSFAVQALVLSRRPAAEEAIRAATKFLAHTQRTEPVPDAARHFRHPGAGGWPLSTKEQGRSISDGTAEALEALFAAEEAGVQHDVNSSRVRQAVEFILSLQNRDGGWATYDGLAGGTWLEKLNYSDIFDNLMVDYSTNEPTGSAVSALRHYLGRSPADLTAKIRHAIARGERYLLGNQRPDGSWYGMWGVCFTYGTWFAIKALAGSSDPRAAVAIDRACSFLLAHQRSDGGWGEAVQGARAHRYIHTETSQPAMTAWALLTLVQAGRSETPAARRAAGFLVRSQLPDGGWEGDYLAGVFNGSAGMNYDAYRWVFPLWALSAFAGSAPEVRSAGQARAS